MGWDDDKQNPWGSPKKTGNNHTPNNDELEEFLKAGQEKFRKFFHQGGNGKKSSQGGGNGVSKGFLLILVAIGFILWGASGFYIIQPDQEGVVLRFGEYNRVTGPGLNYSLPYPVEKVRKVTTTRLNREEIGFRSLPSRGATTDNIREKPEESLMLTGDENIVDIKFEVQWKINNARDYLFNVRDLPGESTVKSAAESAMREVVGKLPITEPLTDGRSRIEQEAKEILQSILDDYEQGIEIVRLQMKDVDPPKEVINAFREVQTARQDKERSIEQAKAYRNSVLPRARGEAERIIQEATAYANEVTAHAEGEASRFNAVYNEYRQAKNVTRKRMHLEAMEEIMSGIEKVMIDSGKNGTGVVPYLPLPEVQKRIKGGQ